MILRSQPLYDPMKDLATVSMLAMAASAIDVHPSLPVQNLRELIDYVKANPSKLTYGSPGAGTLPHLDGELLKSLEGMTDLPHVPYRGAGPALADLIGGQIRILVSAMTSQVNFIAPANYACWRRRTALASLSRRRYRQLRSLGFQD